MMRKLVTLLLLLGAPSLAAAQETIDLGVLKQSDISVVQKLLYPKEGRSELGLHLGWMPFDPYTTTPVAALSYGSFMSETLGWEVTAGGGYGLKNHTYRELEGPAYGVSPDAYRYLASLLADVQWSPIYAKMNVMNRGVVHHDVYLLGGLGGTLEQAVQPDHTFAFAPTLGLGLGVRLFLPKNMAIRVQLRDDLLVESRAKTETTYLKQNVGVTIGLMQLSKVKQ